jgi:hypothetical protein
VEFVIEWPALISTLGVLVASRNGSRPYLEIWLSRKSTPNSRGNVCPSKFLQPFNSRTYCSGSLQRIPMSIETMSYVVRVPTL